MTEEDRMTAEEWLAIKNHDESYNGKFYYGLRTTGIVCKPSCTARACQARNVVIFPSIEDALRDGYRPCRKCRPDQPGFQGAKPELAQRARKYLTEHAMEPFRLEQIAEALYVNKSYLARTYHEVVGQTLLETHSAIRIGRAKELLTHMELSVTQVSFQCGFSSSSYFARVFQKVTGVNPTEWRTAYLKKLEQAERVD